MEASSMTWAELHPRKSKVHWGRINKQKAVDHLGGHCSICLGVFPAVVYDFHHIDPREKEMNVSGAIGCSPNGIPQRIYDELRKTTLLCSNCHRIEHNKVGVWRG